jgi:hypothetical protein
MSGLNLQTGFRVQSAAPPSAAGTTITQAAYGPASGALPGAGDNIPMLGTVGAGLVAVGLLVWLWTTLPR